MVSLMVLLEATGFSLGQVSAAIGAGVVTIGAGLAISRIGAAAMEAIARQPEAAGDIRSGMIVSCALIEGVSFFALAVCFLILFV